MCRPEDNKQNTEEQEYAPDEVVQEVSQRILEQYLEAYKELAK